MRFGRLHVFMIVVTLMTIGTLGLWRVRARSQTVRMPQGQRISLELRRTSEERESGLSGRPGLPKDRGMLFAFDHPGIYPFWMPDMRFSIDIIYFKDKRVTEVFENVPFPAPGDEPATVRPFLPADRVLEVNAGEAARYGLVPGAEVRDLP